MYFFHTQQLIWLIYNYINLEHCTSYIITTNTSKLY